jgi:beta-galactosidase GanA
MKTLSLALAFATTSVFAGAASDLSRPHLETRHGARQLIVDGKPFLVLGGELRNSSSSSREYMKRIWPQLVEKRLNTVVGAVTWELIEPEEGKFDFTSVDNFIEDARANRLHIVFLWFASWKNGLSSYPPFWVKTNPQRFPWVKNSAGKTLDILSTFSDGSFDEATQRDGVWAPGRRLNGDETDHNRRWQSIRSFGIYRHTVFQRN